MSKRNQNRPGYKKTKIGWIPKDWEFKKIEEISSVITGSTPLTNDKTNYGKEFLFVSPFDLGSKKYIINTEKRLSKKGFALCRKIPAGSVLFTCIGSTIGKIGIAGKTLATNQQINSIIPTNNINKEYVFYAIYNIAKQIKSLASEQAVPIVNKSDFQIFKIPIPHISDQKKISKILSTWDRAIEQVQKLIEAKKKLKKGLMQQLLTGRLRFPEFGRSMIKKIFQLTKEIGNLKAAEQLEEAGYKKTTIGWIPEDWDIRRLEKLGTFFKGKGILKNELVEDGLPCIRYGEIYTTHNLFIKKFYSFINTETAKYCKPFKKKDILFTGSGETSEDIGKSVAYLDDEVAYAGGDIIILRPNERAESIYLAYILNSCLGTIQRISYGQGHSVVHIYSRDLKKIIIPIPSFPEQKRIADALSASDREIDELRKKEISLIKQKKGLMQKLLTGEIRVKI